MESNPIDLSILMRLLLMELLYKLLSLQELDLKLLIVCFWSMSLLFHLVLKLLVEWWLFWFLEILLSQLRNLKLSLPMQTINLVSWSKFSRENVKWLKTTIFWVNSILMVFHLHQEESLKLKLASKLMKMVSWMWVLLIRELPRMPKLLLQITKVDYQKNRLRDLSKMLKNTKMLMRKSERELKLKMLLRATVSQLNILLRMKNLRINLMLLKRVQLRLKLEKLKLGFQAILRLKLPNMKENSKLLRMYSIL